MIRFLAAIFLIAGLVLVWKSISPLATGRVTSAIGPPVGVETNLAKDTRSGVVYQLPPKDQELLLQSVDFFCVKKYHRDSCIHHLITCGVPCMVAIPKPQRRIIFADYQKLRAERGLPPLPNVPHTDEEQ